MNVKLCCFVRGIGLFENDLGVVCCRGYDHVSSCIYANMIVIKGRYNVYIKLRRFVSKLNANLITSSLSRPQFSQRQE